VLGPWPAIFVRDASRWKEGQLASDLCSCGRHPLFAKAFGYINPIHLRCRDYVHWQVEISLAQDPGPESELPEDTEEPAGSQSDAIDALHGQDDHSGTELIALRSRSLSFSDLSEHAADDYILKTHTAIGLDNGSAHQDVESSRQDDESRRAWCRPMWFTAENKMVCALRT
jgi:hypothetical protein